MQTARDFRHDIVVMYTSQDFLTKQGTRIEYLEIRNDVFAAVADFAAVLFDLLVAKSFWKVSNKLLDGPLAALCGLSVGPLSALLLALCRLSASPLNAQ